MREMRRDQKGFTLVELIIAVAILSIVAAAVCGFIVVGSRSYAAANSDITVQQDAQLALNQMSDVLIDTTRSVNYAGYDASGSPTLVLKDSELAFAPSAKSLTMYNGTSTKQADGSVTVEEGNGNKNYQFYWDKTDETLYYAEVPITTDTFPALGDPGWVVLADHVTDFSIDLTQMEEKRVAQIAMTFINGDREYNTSNNITVRNKVGINDVQLASLDRSKTLSIAIKDLGVIIEPGEKYHFSVPTVTGRNVTDKSVVWSMDPAYAGSSYFTDTANGILKIADNEPGGTLNVVITTNAVDSDGNHAMLTLPVNIKRVTKVDLSKTSDTDTGNGPNEISPGCTFTVSANVTGFQLGDVCSVCGDDVAMDKAVVAEGNPYGNPYKWIIHNPSASGGTGWDPNNYVEIIESKEDHATFRVKDNAPVSDGGVTYGVVIQAMSLLSTQDNTTSGRHYDSWVPGAISFTIKQGAKKEIKLEHSLQWGASVLIECQYPEDFTTGIGFYLICARVKERDSEVGEKIMIFKTTGSNTRVTPDVFGVEDISKPWTLSLQVLDPGRSVQEGVGPSEKLYEDLQNQIHDATVKDLVQDYLNNCDATGNYVGTKYKHTQKYDFPIDPPEIFYKYNGQENLGGELTLKPVYTLMGPERTTFGVHYVKNTRGQRDGGDWNNRIIRFKVYKEDANGHWGEDYPDTKIYYYYQQDGTHRTDETEKGEWKGEQRPYNGALYFNIGAKGDNRATNATIQLDFNRKDMFPQAVGKYHIVPVIQYYHDPGIDTSYGIFYASYQPNYWHLQVYDAPESAIHFEVKNGGTLELWSYYNNKFTKGEICFPTPSEAGFTEYFNTEVTDWRDAKKLNDFALQDKNGQLSVYSPSQMRCRYISTSGTYELELFYYYRDSVWNRAVEVSAGVFKCAAGGDRWERAKSGTFDSQLEKGQYQFSVDGSTADVNFNSDGTVYNGKMYIPLPKETGFGFQLKQGQEQTKDWISYKYQPTGSSQTQDVSFAKVKCTYDQSSDKYTLSIFTKNWSNGSDVFIAKFECTSNGDRWTQVN